MQADEVSVNSHGVGPVSLGETLCPGQVHPCHAGGACDCRAWSQAGWNSSLCAVSLPTRHFQIILASQVAYLQGQNVLTRVTLVTSKIPVKFPVVNSDSTF